MDIGPVSPIRPVTSIRSFSDGSDLSRVSPTQDRNQSRDDEYSPAGRQPGRGLEDEEDEQLATEEDPVTTPLVPPPGKVSLFA